MTPGFKLHEPRLKANSDVSESREIPPLTRGLTEFFSAKGILVGVVMNKTKLRRAKRGAFFCEAGGGVSEQNELSG